MQNLPVDTDSVAPKYDGRSPNLPVRKTGYNVLFTNLVRVGCFALARSMVVGKPGNEQITLWLGKELRCFGAVGENLPDDEGQGDWDETFN